MSEMKSTQPRNQRFAASQHGNGQRQDSGIRIQVVRRGGDPAGQLDAANAASLADGIPDIPELLPLADVPVPEAIKPPVCEDDLRHRHFRREAFWQQLPAFRQVSREEFLSDRFQIRHTVKNINELRQAVGGIADADFLADVEKGLTDAPMNLRISPYLLSLIDWQNPYEDPIRLQFIPVGSRLLPDHPKLAFDSLHEQADAPVPNLVHRYHDKALFLPLDVCPVYCRFCTRSYSVGPEAAHEKTASFRASVNAWQPAIAYLLSRPEIEDVVISGGDTYNLAANRLRYIGETLLAIPHIRRIRFASKGPCVMPMKILTDRDWTQTLIDITRLGREKGKEVALHTHFNSVNEITDITREAMELLFRAGVTVRNQSVLIRGVNDTPEQMVALVRQLSFMNIHPYYVYMHDMVKGVETLRTPLSTALEIERHVRGSTAGFNTPAFVTDVPGGGGKRDAHSYDFYDTETGISVYRSPAVARDRVYLYFDPLHSLSADMQRRWQDPAEQALMIATAIARAGLTDLAVAS